MIVGFLPISPLTVNGLSLSSAKASFVPSFCEDEPQAVAVMHMAPVQIIAVRAYAIFRTVLFTIIPMVVGRV